jgi:hypothetical protein
MLLAFVQASCPTLDHPGSSRRLAHHHVRTCAPGILNPVPDLPVGSENLRFLNQNSVTWERWSYAAWIGPIEMFQLFLRARAHNYLRARLGDQTFRARSADRDAETDRSRIGSILEAIEDALHAAELEQSGLSRRVEDVLARAAVTLGNGTDEYLERDALDNHYQDLFSTEIANGQRRLKELTTSITHFKFLKAATLSRFPDHKPASPGN